MRPQNLVHLVELCFGGHVQCDPMTQGDMILHRNFTLHHAIMITGLQNYYVKLYKANG